MNGTDYHWTDSYFIIRPHFTPGMLAVLLLATLVVIVPYWKISGKAGFPRAFGALMCIPLVNLVLLYVLAFSKWKVAPSLEENPVQKNP
jgi:hypothetical protein